MIPSETVTNRAVFAEMPPPDSEKVTGLTDSELGGVAVNDSSEGLLAYVWTCGVVGLDVVLQREGAPPVVLFQSEGVSDIALAFTQSMQPTVAWRDNSGELWLRWYDGSIPGYRIQAFGSGRCPRLSLDDKRAISLNDSDIIFAYISNGALRYRQQRDAFGIERTLISPVLSGENLVRIGMAGLQMQFVMDRHFTVEALPAP